MQRRSKRAMRTIIILTLAAMLILAANVFLVAVRKVHLRSGTDLSRYADSANTVRETTKALRGNIYDRNGTIIAQDNKTYNIYCILSPEREHVEGQKYYVEDREGTAKELSRILGMDYDLCLHYLSGWDQGIWQTELGTAGRSISQSTMEEIAALNLPGVEFTDSIKRVYPLGTFASNLIGFAQSDETGSTIGRMGTELYLDSYLRGTDGYRVYQADKDGHILPGMKEDSVSATNGYDVYLTLDQEIQEALEESFQITRQRFNPTRVWGAVMEIKTGKILAWGQYPSFDPNTLDIEDYNNYGTQLPYEPGSTLKPFTWAAAINEGTYDGSAQVYSGPFYWNSDSENHPFRVESSPYQPIENASKKNWGWIDFDHGLMYSSNVVAATVQTELITPEINLDYLKKFGFFQSVASDGLPEETGVLTFHWPMEKLALSYGQGSSVTMLQMLQAYSAIFGDGTMVRPYYVESIRDHYDSNHVIYQATTKVTGHPITEETAREVQGILYRTVNDDDGTAKYYQIPETTLMGKTGTTQVYVNNSYLSGYTIASLMSALPGDNPQVLVYYCFEAPYDRNAHYYTEATQNLLRKTAMRLGYAGNASAQENPDNLIEAGEYDKIEIQDMPSLVNHSLYYSEEKLKNLNVEIHVLGSGDTVIDQYPVDNAMVSTGQKVFLLTDTNSFIMPDMTGWTRKDVTGLWAVTQFGFKLTGEGKVTSQSIPPGTQVTRGTEIEVVFESE